MQHLRTYIHTAFAISVIAALILPGVVTLAHSFENHDHLAQCENPNDTHVHKKNIDCEFNSINFKNNGVIAFAEALTTYIPILYKSQVHHTEKFYTYSIEKSDDRGPPSGDFLYS